MILCAIGGDDTYRLLPYLFDNDKGRILLLETSEEKPSPEMYHSLWDICNSGCGQTGYYI